MELTSVQYQWVAYLIGIFTGIFLVILFKQEEPSK